MQPETSMGMSDSEKSLTMATDNTHQQITTTPTSSNIMETSEIGEQIRVKIVVSLPKDDKEAWEKAKRKVDNYLQAENSMK
jgi:Holliday junction resolvase RusA-like endonuclease